MRKTTHWQLASPALRQNAGVGSDSSNTNTSESITSMPTCGFIAGMPGSFLEQGESKVRIIRVVLRIIRVVRTLRIIRYGSKVYHWRIGCSVSRFCRSVISLARDRTLYCPANILTCTPILITFVHSNDSSPILITFVHSNDSSPILITFVHSNDSSPILITFVHSEGVRRILGNDVQSAEMDMDRPGSGKHHSLAARPRHDNAGRYKNVSVAVVCSVPPIRTRSNRSNKVEAGPRLHLCSNHLPNGGALA